MPKKKVSNPITDQEMAFARLVLSGGMTDRQAAEAAGLNPGSAAYTKSKPSVCAYMHEHHAAVQQQLVQQEADLSRPSRLPRQAVGPAVERAVERLHRFNLDREQVLARLWDIANLSPETTRNSITGQVKALSMIIAMQNFIPDRKAASGNKSPTPAAKSNIYVAEWLRKQQATTTEPQPSPVSVQEEAAPDLSSRRPAPACRGSAVEGPAVPTPPVENHVNPSEAQPTAPYVSVVGAFVPDAINPFSTNRNPFSRFRRPR
jgi:hypothetical protein